MPKSVYTLGLCIALAVGAAIAGCDAPDATQSQPDASDDDASNNATAGMPATRVTLVNTVCPIMGGPAKSTVTTQWNGQTVGFCCPECIPEWEKLANEEKFASLTAAEKAADPSQPASEDQGAT